MEDIRENIEEDVKKIAENYFNTGFIRAALSNPRIKEKPFKVRIRPVTKGEALKFQFETFYKNQAFHKNLEKEEVKDELLLHMGYMKQLQLETKRALITVLVSKKGRLSIKEKLRKDPVERGDFSHDRQKNYILKEGAAIPFLEDLGIMTREGKVVKARFDKFRQVNRFLEFIEDILSKLPKGREIKILDFGCGKAYLAFAMYYYLHELKGLDIRITGLDLKKEVIRSCNLLAKKYAYEKLTFLEGDIADYEEGEGADMVVALHACDTATDLAIAKAVGWKASVILSVPCCQHELNGQLQNEALRPILKYGLLKERFAALLTDGLRAAYLEREGYDVQVLEFIDMEHTPKNILLRAVRTDKKGNNGEIIRECERAFNVSPLLGKLLKEKGEDRR